MHLQRHPDWPAALAALLRERRTTPYVYGATDCGCLVLDAIEAMTGTVLISPADRPTSRVGAARFLLARGYGDVEGMMTALLGPALPTARLAGRGDVVSFDAQGERHLAVCAGTSAATPGRDGLLWVPRALWLNGWKAG